MKSFLFLLFLLFFFFTREGIQYILISNEQKLNDAIFFYIAIDDVFLKGCIILGIQFWYLNQWLYDANILKLQGLYLCD